MYTLTKEKVLTNFTRFWERKRKSTLGASNMFMYIYLKGGLNEKVNVMLLVNIIYHV
mgnify:CR=1 FL=1